MPAEDEENESVSWIQELIVSYRIPLVFLILAVLLIGGVFLLWQSNKKSAAINFTDGDIKSASISSKIKADIEGFVVRPGVYELPSGSRIQDLLVVAGGLGAAADREWVAKSLNQAAKLTDGAKIYIPDKNTSNNINTANTANSLININSASLSELDQLSGVGPVTAQKIIDGRPYQTIEELVTKKIIGSSVFDKIKDKITLY